VTSLVTNGEFNIGILSTVTIMEKLNVCPKHRKLKTDIYVKLSH